MTETRLIHIGRRVRAVRVRLGLTQPQMAKQLGVHWVTLSRWERDVHKPRTDQLVVLAELAGVPVSWFFAQDDHYFEEEK